MGQITNPRVQVIGFAALAADAQPPGTQGSGQFRI
jgi:hypothetical protein